MSFPATILLADDEPHIRKYVGLILKQLGSAQIVEAANGAEAVALFQSAQPQLVLLDVNMPILDGLGALKQIRELDPEATVIMLTSLTTRQVVETAAEHGAANYIRKDTPKEEIAQALAETIKACFEDGEPPAA